MNEAQVEQLRLTIVNGVGFDPADRRDMLLEPRTRFLLSDAADYKCLTLWRDRTAVIRIGGATWPVLNTFTRTAAAYFVHDGTGRRPAAVRLAARNALASTIDWFAVGADRPRVAAVELVPRQENPANAFAAYAFRFLICHELAHVVLEHGESFGRLQHDPGVATLRAFQQDEDAADRFGLRLQMQSLGAPMDGTTALSAPLYLIMMLRAFQEFRLAILSELVDERGWAVEYTHPPYLARVLAILGEAGGLAGEAASEGLRNVHGELESLVGKVWDAAYRRRDGTAGKTEKIVHGPTVRRAALAAQVEVSPTGVLMALDRDADRSWAEPDWPYAGIVPPELLDLLRLDPKARAAAIA